MGTSEGHTVSNLDLAVRLRGCLLGGACGDALGAPVEFEGLDAIRRRHGDRGITEFDEAYGRIGAITDDTQMTLFTAEGLIRASVRWTLKGICHAPSVVHHAYLRWLLTQGGRPRNRELAREREGWLIGVKELWSSRAPGNTCLQALRATSALGEPAANNSKGCGGVMRVAPAGLIANEPFALGAELARLTHGHPSGYLSAGCLAALLGAISTGVGLEEGLDLAETRLVGRGDADETLAALRLARDLAGHGRQPVVPASLGGGWIGEEALAIAVWCALVADDPVDAVILAVNHDGDSDSTGSITGQILGALHGPGWLPDAWLAKLELRTEIERLASDLAASVDLSEEQANAFWNDYPGW